MKVIEFRQLCALVKSIMLRDPSMDYTTWKELSLQQLHKWRFTLPVDGGTDMLQRAMASVEFAVYRTLGPRAGMPKELARKLVATEPQPVKPDWREGRTSHPAGWDTVQQLIGQLDHQDQPSTRRLRVIRSVPLKEVTALNEFWRQVADPSTDRLALVRAFAEIAIIRPASWNPKQIRADFEATRCAVGDALCFCCYSARAGRAWHHVIQVQHGGSNAIRNRIPLCEHCHHDVHPWLEPLARRGGGWFSLGDVFTHVAKQKAQRGVL